MGAAARAEVERLAGRLAGRGGAFRLAVRGPGPFLQGLARSHPAQQMTVEGTGLPLPANEIEVIGAAPGPPVQGRGPPR